MAEREFAIVSANRVGAAEPAAARAATRRGSEGLILILCERMVNSLIDYQRE